MTTIETFCVPVAGAGAGVVGVGVGVVGVDDPPLLPHAVVRPRKKMSRHGRNNRMKRPPMDVTGVSKVAADRPLRFFEQIASEGHADLPRAIRRLLGVKCLAPALAEREDVV